MVEGERELERVYDERQVVVCLEKMEERVCKMERCLEGLSKDVSKLYSLFFQSRVPDFG